MTCWDTESINKLSRIRTNIIFLSEESLITLHHVTREVKQKMNIQLAWVYFPLPFLELSECQNYYFWKNLSDFLLFNDFYCMYEYLIKGNNEWRY